MSAGGTCDHDEHGHAGPVVRAKSDDDIASLYFEGDHWVVHYTERPDPLATRSVVEMTPHPYTEQMIRDPRRADRHGLTVTGSSTGPWFRLGGKVEVVSVAMVLRRVSARMVGFLGIARSSGDVFGELGPAWRGGVMGFLFSVGWRMVLRIHVREEAL